MKMSVKIIEGLKSAYTPNRGLFLIVVVFMGWVVVTVHGLDIFQLKTQTIKQGLSGTQIESITATPIKGIYEVRAGHNVFYSDRTGRYLIFGHLYDTQTATDLTLPEEGLTDSTAKTHPISVTWKDLSSLEGIITGKQGGIPVAVFLDPDCPYCSALMRELEKNKSLEVHVFLMPIPELHPDAPNDSRLIWCSNNRPAALTDLMLTHTLSPALNRGTDCDLSGLERINHFAAQHDISATPALIRQDGQVHFGYLSLSELTAWAMAGETRSHE